jgi:hypothetical protein
MIDMNELISASSSCSPAIKLTFPFNGPSFAPGISNFQYHALNGLSSGRGREPPGTLGHVGFTASGRADDILEIAVKLGNVALMISLYSFNSDEDKSRLYAREMASNISTEGVRTAALSNGGEREEKARTKVEEDGDKEEEEESS